MLAVDCWRFLIWLSFFHPWWWLSNFLLILRAMSDWINLSNVDDNSLPNQLIAWRSPFKFTLPICLYLRWCHGVKLRVHRGCWKRFSLGTNFRPTTKAATLRLTAAVAAAAALVVAAAEAVVVDERVVVKWGLWMGCGRRKWRRKKPRRQIRRFPESVRWISSLLSNGLKIDEFHDFAAPILSPPLNQSTRPQFCCQWEEVSGFLKLGGGVGERERGRVRKNAGSYHVLREGLGIVEVRIPLTLGLSLPWLFHKKLHMILAWYPKPCCRDQSHPD